MARPFIEVDNSELEKFTQQFSELKEHFDDEIKNMLREVARQFLEDVKKRTPRGTGNLRKHWTIDNLTLDIKSDKSGYWVYLVNTVDYASYVEHGHYSYNQYNVGGVPYTVKNRTVPYYDGNPSPVFVYGVFYLKKTELQYDKGKMQRIVNREMTNLFKSKGW